METINHSIYLFNFYFFFLGVELLIFHTHAHIFNIKATGTVQSRGKQENGRAQAAQKDLQEGERAEEGGVMQRATCLSGPAIGNHLICITQFIVPTRGLTLSQSWCYILTLIIPYIESKRHLYQYTAL